MDALFRAESHLHHSQNANCAILHKVVSDFVVDSHPVHEHDDIYRPHPVLHPLLYLLDKDPTVLSTCLCELKPENFV
jgi:hypothetical protein